MAIGLSFEFWLFRFSKVLFFVLKYIVYFQLLE